jgi:hypothetical protein
MKITEDAAVYEKTHATVVDEFGIHLNPRVLIRILETALDGRVTNTHAERRYRAGKQEAEALHERLVKARYVVQETVSLLDDVLAWTGGPDREKHVREQLTALLADIDNHLNTKSP